MSDENTTKETILEVGEELGELAKVLPNAPVAPAHGIAAIALSMSMKFHDITTVKDGALYQQYKLEGKNMIPLHLDMVFADAIRIEEHLLGASDRIAKLIVDVIASGVEESEADITEDEKVKVNEP